MTDRMGGYTDGPRVLGCEWWGELSRAQPAATNLFGLTLITHKMNKNIVNRSPISFVVDFCCTSAAGVHLKREKIR